MTVNCAFLVVRKRHLGRKFERAIVMTLDSWVRSVEAWCALTGIHKRDVGASAWLQAGFNLRSWVVECVSSVDRKIKGV